MKVWITKYALTDGVEEREVDQKTWEENDYVSVKGSWNCFRKGRAIFDNKEAAVAAAEKMRTRKIKSLEKSLKKMTELKF